MYLTWKDCKEIVGLKQVNNKKSRTSSSTFYDILSLEKKYSYLQVNSQEPSLGHFTPATLPAPQTEIAKSAHSLHALAML